MTVHMVRIYLEPPKGEADSAVDNWVSNHTEWTDGPVEHSLSTSNTDSVTLDGTEFVEGDYRFIQAEPATELLDDLEARLQSLQGGLWYTVAYHVCEADEMDAPDCSFQDSDAEIRENGSTPSGLPPLR